MTYALIALALALGFLAVKPGTYRTPEDVETQGCFRIVLGAASAAAFVVAAGNLWGAA